MYLLIYADKQLIHVSKRGHELPLWQYAFFGFLQDDKSSHVDICLTYKTK